MCSAGDRFCLGGGETSWRSICRYYEQQGTRQCSLYPMETTVPKKHCVDFFLKIMGLIFKKFRGFLKLKRTLVETRLSTADFPGGIH